jgi:digeranylgeranylglycerophospholipid reductase
MAHATYDFDAIVVGGGPAGLSAAAAAAKDGLRVAIIEKEPCIANSIRTSGVTWLTEGLDLPHGFYNPIRRYGICSISREHVFETTEPEACVLDVRKLYIHLAEKAAELGAKIFLRTEVNAALYENEKNSVKVTAKSPRGSIDFRGELVIDASGFSTVVGTSLGLASRYKRFGIGAEYEAYAENVEMEKWELIVGRAFSPAGYAWIFPLGRNKVRIGVGVGRPQSNEDPYERLMNLLEKRPGPLKRLGRICPLEFHSGVVPNEGPRGLTIGERVLLVGDSAGHLNPLVLEGIRFAMKFGRIAGETAKQVVDNGDAKRVRPEKYEEIWKRDVWNNFQVGLDVQKKWLELSDEQWDKEMSILESLSAKEFLQLLRCQFSVVKLTRLAASHPELLKSRFFSTILGAKARKALS